MHLWTLESPIIESKKRCFFGAWGRKVQQRSWWECGINPLSKIQIKCYLQQRNLETLLSKLDFTTDQHRALSSSLQWSKVKSLDYSTSAKSLGHNFDVIYEHTLRNISSLTVPLFTRTYVGLGKDQSPCSTSFGWTKVLPESWIYHPRSLSLSRQKVGVHLWCVK